MLTSTGKLHERVAYDSYGTARHHWKDDVDGDGDVDSSDKSLVTGGSGKHIYDSGYDPGADIDRSGTIDSTDAGLVSSTTIAALASGMISDRKSGGPDNTIGYDGYVFNPENLLYTVRFRHYDTGLGRWLERDPAGYVGGSNLFEYVGSDPIWFIDPLGLLSDDDGDVGRWHHLIPANIRKLLRDHKLLTFNVNDADCGVLFETVDHLGHPKVHADYEKLLQELLEADLADPDIKVTKEHILKRVDEIRNCKDAKYKDVSDWLKKSKPAPMNHFKWNKLTRAEKIEYLKKIFIRAAAKQSGEKLAKKIVTRGGKKAFWFLGPALALLDYLTTDKCAAECAADGLNPLPIECQDIKDAADAADKAGRRHMDRKEKDIRGREESLLKEITPCECDKSK